MRRGTQSAVFFGYLLCLIRTQQKQTMRQIAEKFDGNAATVSQIEKGQRALKEPAINAWADALSMTHSDLNELWWLSQGFVRNRFGNRTFYTDYIDLHRRIMRIMNQYVRETAIDIPVIEKPQPITRPRRKFSTPKSLESLLKSLTAPERNQVLGYIDAIIERKLMSNSCNEIHFTDDELRVLHNTLSKRRRKLRSKRTAAKTNASDLERINEAANKCWTLEYKIRTFQKSKK